LQDKQSLTKFTRAETTNGAAVLLSILAFPMCPLS